ncbi:uncharacterized protein isoform X2 [Rhodnius prolixus]|uniref:Putative aquaporin major intrinsic protein family n=1 Tax=Rhodnius prolixus TaxID=13249 RepID=A0A4P6D6T1_RHOPR
MNLKFKCQLVDDEKEQSFKEICLSYLRIFVAEFIGSFLYVFFGCACINNLSSFFGVSICYALVVGASIQVFAAISLAHLNPAITLCFYIFGIISLPSSLVYLIAQCLGGIAGAFTIKDLSVYNPSSIITKRGTEGNCCTFVGEGVSIGRAFAWEFGQTCFLILGVCSIIHPKNLARLESYPVKMGILIFALLYSGTSFTSTGINPMRSFGPAVSNQEWENHWIYWVAPLFASAVASICYHIICLPENGQDLLKQILRRRKAIED